MGRRIQQHSAGGAVLKRDPSGTSALLIKPCNRDRWQLPKGTIDPGETAATSAIREVREEGGVSAKILDQLSPITFFYQMQGQRFVKTVDFFLMEYESGSPEDHDDEVDNAVWFPIDKALQMLTFDSERAVVQAALDAYATRMTSAAS